MRGKTMAIWLDLEDLVRYFHHDSRPTGIQRLSFEVCRKLARLGGASEEIKFCRHAGTPSGFRGIHFPALEAGILAASASVKTAAPVATTANAPPPPPPRRKPDSFVMRVASSGHRFPPQIRRPLGVIGRSVVQILDALPDLARATKAELTPGHTQRIQIGGHQFDLEGDDVVFAPGDWLVSLGATWETPYKLETFEYLREHQVKFAVLAHDLIPELFPEWAVKANVKNYRAWLRTTVMAADVLFANSASTAADLTECIHAMGQTAPAPIVLPVGSVPPAEPVVDPDAAEETPLPERPYVLMVSTIEVRKNHTLLFKIWRRMLRDMPADDVPDLVFAGKVGWLTADLMQQLENCDWLDGRIRFVPSPSDAALAALYRGCLFTVFPSLYEGWGLPVTESLSFGKTVAASNRASIPEAGGAFCSYYDPEDVHEAYAVIRGLIEQPERVAAMEAKIAKQYRPATWEDTAAAILHALTPARDEVDEMRDMKIAAD
jgi:glycosyltransferase involved in cell wall biosynthesis